MIFPIFIPINRTGKDIPEESKYDYKTAKQLHEDYTALIKNIFSKYNFNDWIGQMNEDPFSPRLHYICRTEKRKFIGLFPYKKEIAIVKITSEPEFEESILGAQNLVCKGLEIRVIDKNIRPIINEFCEQYKNKFNEEPRVVE